MTTTPKHHRPGRPSEWSAPATEKVGIRMPQHVREALKLPGFRHAIDTLAREYLGKLETPPAPPCQ